MFVAAEKVVIEVALNERCSPETNPNVPLTAEECAADALEAADAGAAVVHFHLRDASTGRDVMTAEAYAVAIRLINEERPDLLVRVPYHAAESEIERFGHVEALALDPTVHLRAAMIDPGTVLFSAFDERTATISGDHVFTVSAAHFRHHLEMGERYGLQSGIVVREPGHVRLAVAAHRVGWMTGALLLQIHLSDDALWGVPPSEHAYDVYTQLVPDDIAYSYVAYTNGPSHWMMNRVALERGAHVRVGIGDRALDEDGSTPTNAELVRRVVAMAAELGRGPATPAEALAIFAAAPSALA